MGMAGIELAVQKVITHNSILFEECMTVSVNDCIQAPFATRFSLRMKHSEGTWLGYDGYDYIKLMTLLPEINRAMIFFAKNGFIAGANDPPGQVATWVPHKVYFDINGVIINDIDTVLLKEETF